MSDRQVFHIDGIKVTVRAEAMARTRAGVGPVFDRVVTAVAEEFADTETQE